MELFFNELSIEGKMSINKDSVIALASVYRSLRRYEITTCRIASEDHQKLHQMIRSMPDYWNIRNFYFSFFRSPYETENVEKEQNEYLEHEWLYDGKTCIGLPLAIILKTAALSIHESDWSAAFVYITKDGESDAVRNISVEQHVDIHIPQIQTSEETKLLVSLSKGYEKRD